MRTFRLLATTLLLTSISFPGYAEDRSVETYKNYEVLTTRSRSITTYDTLLDQRGYMQFGGYNISSDSFLLIKIFKEDESDASNPHIVGLINYLGPKQEFSNISLKGRYSTKGPIRITNIDLDTCDHAATCNRQLQFQVDLKETDPTDTKEKNRSTTLDVSDKSGKPLFSYRFDVDAVEAVIEASAY